MKIHPGQHIHLVGIGGSGMSAIARVLLGQGYRVSGSDRGANDLTAALARDGATVYQGHDAAHIAGADALIVTSAVKDDHVEVAAARAAGIPVYKRQDIMADLMEGKTVIAVAGTKGKTTTTSMIVHILHECGADPSYIVGGVMGNTGTNAGVGSGSVFVVEADEYENMFWGLRPDFIVLTNLEYDHPDFFPSYEAMLSSFQHFIDIMDDKDYGGGRLIACTDDATVRQLVKQRGDKHPFYSSSCYGLGEGVDFRAVDIHVDEEGYTAFHVLFPDGFSFPARIRVPGSHNVRNALAALLTAPPLVGAPMAHAGVPALASFIPPARRFELMGEVGDIAVISDYAHNPMSIRAVLDAAKQRYPEREIWAVWQPHTYSRTAALLDDFVNAFPLADHVLVTDIYAAREQPMPGVTSEAVVAKMQHPDARHTPTFADAAAALREAVKPPAAVIIMSAGDAPQIGEAYLRALREGQD
jgi:UDP-N-acetylmuramate--alanine ligase